MKDDLLHQIFKDNTNQFLFSFRKSKKRKTQLTFVFKTYL